MSYSVNGTTITLTRGDTFKTTVGVFKDGKEYVIKTGDSIRFAMKTTYEDDEPLILKDIPMNSLVLKLDPDDTKDLDFGKYVYDVEMTYATGEVDTFIKGILKLTEEVD